MKDHRHPSRARELSWALPVAFGAAMVLMGCSSSSSTTPPPGDSGTKDSTPHKEAGKESGTKSRCGNPGDMGNSEGIGQYCTKISECNTAAGQICTSIEPSEMTNFCTKPCSGACMPEGFCGEGAQCICLSGTGCGCVPNSCSALNKGNMVLPVCKDGGTEGGAPDTGAPSDGGGAG